MPKSRYMGTQIIRPALPPGVIKRDRLEKEGVSTFASYPPELFENEVVVYHTLQAGERLDYLARKYFFNGRYWWMICMVNGIVDPIADEKEVKREFDINLLKNPELGNYSGIILAVPHDKIIDKYKTEFKLTPNNVMFDLKAALSKEKSDARL